MYLIEICGPRSQSPAGEEEWFTVDRTENREAAKDCYLRWAEDCGHNHDLRVTKVIKTTVEYHCRQDSGGSNQKEVKR